MSTKQDFEQQLRSFVIEQLKRKMQEKGISSENINDNFMLVESGVIDSLGFLELLSQVEKKFNVEIDFSEKDPSEFLSLGGFVKSIATLVK